MTGTLTDTYFDRRMPGEMMSALGTGGFAHSLVQYARSGQYGLDLGLRASPKTKRAQASLYVGTTKAVDLQYLPGKGFRLQAHKTWIAATTSPWNPQWEKWVTADAWDQQWAGVESFIEGCIHSVVDHASHSVLKGSKPPTRELGGYLKEGVVQAGVSRFGQGNPFVVDREAVVGFRDKPTKQRLLTQQRRPLKAALLAAREQGGPAWLKDQLSSTECDLLAISKNGELLTVEIKPEKVPAAALAPLQAWQYAQQFQAWTSECADPGGVLLGMYAQRRSLGLSVNPEEPHLTYPLAVHPAIAISAGVSETIFGRLRRVVQLLREAGLDDPPMRFYTVNLVGRLDQFDPLL